MSDEWGGYRARLEEHAAWFEVDLAAHHDAPEEGRPVLLRVWTARDAEGAATAAVFDAALVDPAMRAMQGRLFEVLANHCGARPVGTATTIERHSMFFYLPSSDGVEETLRSILSPSEDGSHGFEWREDVDWRTYLELLFPTQRELLEIASSRVRTSLLDAGDDLGIPRPVSHVALLPDGQGREELRLELEERGFTVEVIMGDDDELPFGLEFERLDPVDSAAFDGVLDELVGLVADRDGEYEGWETTVAGG